MKKLITSFCIKIIYCLILTQTTNLFAQLTANAGPNRSICLGDSTIIGVYGNPVATGGIPPYTYVWSPTIGLGSSYVSNPLAAPATLTTYTLVVTDVQSNTASSTVTISINPQTNIVNQSTASQTVCANTSYFNPISVTASGTGPFTYQWYKNLTQSSIGGAIISGATTATYTPRSDTVGMNYYYCVVTGACGIKSSTVSGAFTVKPLPNSPQIASVIQPNCSNVVGSVYFTNLPRFGTWTISEVASSTSISDTSLSATFWGLTPGEHSFTVANADGCVSSTSTSVIINPPPAPPTANAGSDLSICAGQLASLAGFIEGAISSVWTTNGTGSFSSPTLVNTIYTPSVSDIASGSVILVLKANGICSSIFDSLMLTINPLPVVSVNSLTICAGQSATLIASGAASYLWPPGINSTAGDSVTFNPPLGINNYKVIGTFGSCADSAIATVTVNQLPTISINNQSICAGTSTTLTATPSVTGGSYYWTPMPETTDTIRVSPISPGTYTYTCAYSLNGCNASGSGTVVVHSQPIANAGPNQTTCLGNQTNFSDLSSITGDSITTRIWNFGDESTSVLQNPIHIFALGSYNILLSVSTPFGCIATDSLQVSVDSVPYLSVLTLNNPSCYGLSNGSTSYAASGSAPFHYSWSPLSDTTNSISNLPAGTYTIVVTDKNGCTNYHSSVLTTPSMIQDSLFATNSPICSGDTTSIFSIVSGGTPPYTLLWDNSSSLSSINVSPASTTSYTQTVTDADFCTTTKSILVDVIPSTNLSGHVSYSGGDVIDGSAILYKYQLFNTHFDTIQIAPLNAIGYYNFTAINHGDYLIKVFPNSSTYPTLIPTYYGNQFMWDSALVQIHGCNINDTANILMVEQLAVSNAGPGTLSGTILQGVGFGRQEGDPIPGVDVKLGKNPGAQIAGCTITDINGQYSFANVDTGSYTLYVDITGLSTDSSYSVHVDGTSNTYNALNYTADSTSVFIINTSTTAVNNNPSSSIENKFSVYPNPSTGHITIDYTLGNDALVLLDIYNVLGIKVANIINIKQLSGSYKYTFENEKNIKLSNGIYIISLTINGKNNIQRLIISK